ncbi:MAG: DMT family transporter [Patescibacteria group bacterium]|jgi:drug/metabolite transporter (DMT)-like permease
MKKGIYLVLITAVVSGLANFFNKFGMQALGKDAFQYTTLKNVIVALVLSLIVLTPWILPKLKKLTKKEWAQLALIGLIGGSIPFLLFFKGLSLTSSVSASFIHKTMFVWVAILAWPILKEKISKLQFLALGILLLGNIIFEGFRGLNWGMAETLILVATLFWAAESVIAKISLKNIDSTVLAWGRMFFGAMFLLGFLLVTGNTAGLLTLSLSQVSWLLLVSTFLTGYVLTWYAALKKLPATVVTCFLVIASPITTFLNSIFVSHKLAGHNIWGVIIILAGILLFWQFKESKIKNQELRKDFSVLDS